MPATVAWIDSDSAERERVQRVLALFQERDTRDELGLGAIRDSISDALFPGTSTIQTRLRYFLFVPWIYRSLEERGVPSSEMAAHGRRLELDLVGPLADSNDRGIFGISAGRGLKRLPSAVYWGGLESWGIRRFTGTQAQYFRALDGIYRRRNHSRSREDGDVVPDRITQTWHPSLPQPPAGFPAGLSFDLTAGEAEFIRERILHSWPTSLLAHLAGRGRSTDVDFPWHHPDQATFSAEHLEILRHGRLFTEVMHGAAILYNLMLAEELPSAELAQEHAQALESWAQQIHGLALEDWDLGGLWALTKTQPHTVTPPAMTFVTRWVQFVKEDPASVERRADARHLVRSRERRLKGGRSRFYNRRALEENWGGRAGLGRYNYRWPNVQTLLADLYAGLGVDGA